MEAIQIDGVQHEFTTVEGVYEDITDIEEEPDDAPVEDKKSAPAADARKVVEEETAPETSEKL